MTYVLVGFVMNKGKVHKKMQLIINKLLIAKLNRGYILDKSILISDL